MTTLFITILGAATVLVSIIVAFKFGKSQFNGRAYSLSRAIKWQLLGEAVIGLGTLAFALAAHYGMLGNFSDQQQSLLRFIMFTATSITTIHLWCVVVKLEGRK